MNRGSMGPKCPRLLCVPGSPVACPGGQGGVIYREDENLSRKFVPINIAVPGGSSPRGAGAGQTLRLLLQPSVRLRAEARGEAAVLGPHARGGGSTCSDAQGARAQRLAREQRAVGPGGSRGRDANHEQGLQRGKGEGGEGFMHWLPEAARPRRSPKRKLVLEAGILLQWETTNLGAL